MQQKENKKETTGMKNGDNLHLFYFLNCITYMKQFLNNLFFQLKKKFRNWSNIRLPIGITLT